VLRQDTVAKRDTLQSFASKAPRCSHNAGRAATCEPRASHALKDDREGSPTPPTWLAVMRGEKRWGASSPPTRMAGLILRARGSSTLSMNLGGWMDGWHSDTSLLFCMQICKPRAHQEHTNSAQTTAHTQTTNSKAHMRAHPNDS